MYSFFAFWFLFLLLFVGIFRNKKRHILFVYKIWCWQTLNQMRPGFERYFITTYIHTSFIGIKKLGLQGKSTTLGGFSLGLQKTINNITRFVLVWHVWFNLENHLRWEGALLGLFGKKINQKSNHSSLILPWTARINGDKSSLIQR